MRNTNKVFAAVLSGFLLILSCAKDAATKAAAAATDTAGSTVTPPVEPAIAATQGFFMDNWQPKVWTDIASSGVVKPAGNGAVNITVDLSQELTKVSNYIFGNNTNPYMGQFIDAPVLMNNITNLSPNILRFPGGSLSDVYFWNQSSQPPADAPAQLLDANGNSSSAYYWYGNNLATSTMTVDDYYAVLQQTQSTGLITVNYAYARYGTGPAPVQTAAHLAADWVRYDKGRTKYWEVGNEIYGSWEAGYQINTSTNHNGQAQVQDGTTYGSQFLIFADSMRAAAAQVGNTGIKIGIVLSADDDGRNVNPGQIFNWNNKVLNAEGNSADFFVLHNYYTPYDQNSAPAVILGTPVPGTSGMMARVKSAVVNAGAVQKPVAMDEWNIQSEGSGQMVSNIAGLHAVMVLGEVLKNQISMASRWDLANAWDNGNDMGMFSNSAPGGDNEPGAPDWNPRPAFYYMYYFQNFMGDHLVSAVSSDPNIAAYGSSFSSGQAGVILLNETSGNYVANVKFKNFVPGSKYYFYTLNGGSDNMPFSQKVYVNNTGPAGSSGGPANYLSIPANSAGISGGILVTIPAYGAVFLVADGK